MPAAAGPGGFALAELITDDVDARAAFYGALFGWTAGDPAGPLGRREWRLDGTAVSLLLPRPAAMPREIPPYWDAYFTVTGVSAATARDLGGRHPAHAIHRHRQWKHRRAP
ncbi:hypothetical protein [Actinacidiphila glaucinigra]|uniref:hypothetical protein n=1 Tax=Actinacidiphila glaucinigra TaxID=235986 RepID=UPI002E35AF77|nr:hypothetical protein [Actinacidiphila glaucinigra]